MSEKIKSSLMKLDRAIDGLQTVVENKAKSLKTPKVPQQEMFGMFSTQPRQVNGKGAIDAKAVARKLDRAIEKVEELLKEGA